MTIRSEDNMNDALKKLIASGDIDTPINDAVINHFLANTPPQTSPAFKKELHKRLMAEKFKAMIIAQKGVIPQKYVDGLSFGSYIALIKSKLKASDEIIAIACKVSEQELLKIINATQNIFITSAQVVADIIDCFSIPMNVVETLLKNTVAIANEKGNVSTVFLRSAENSQGANAAYDAALLAIRKSEGKPPAEKNPVNPEFLSKIREELAKRGRKDLIH